MATTDQLALLYDAAYKAGFRGQDLQMAIAIALGESAGRPGARGDVTLQDAKWGPSIGLFQIRSLRNPGQYSGTDAMRVEGRLDDPYYNAQVAYELFKERGWEPWSVYTAGLYERHLDEARQAMAIGGTTQGEWDRATYIGDNAGGDLSVRQQQEELTRLGYDPGPIDGILGDRTKAAIAQFQRDNGLTADGVWGPNTQAAYENTGGTTSPGPGRTTGTGADTNTGQATNADTFTPPETPKEMEEFIRTHYPSMVWALDHPELGQLLTDAAMNDWTPEKFNGMLQGTDWWQETSDSQRKYKFMQETDPATYQREMVAARHTVRAMMSRLGYKVPTSKVNSIAHDLMWLGLTEEQLKQAVIAGARPVNVNALDRGRYGGMLAEAYEQVERISEQYLLNIGSKNIRQWTTDIVNGTKTIESFKQYAETWSRNNMPWLSEMVSQGYSPQETLNAYRQGVAETLEIAPGEIDWTDRKWRNVARARDEASGEWRLANEEEVNRNVRRQFNDQWQRTTRARNQALQLSQTIAQTFGRTT